MIDIKDLQIGDWVMDVEKPVQVTSLTCDGIIETTRRISNIELIEPIPLTPEILEKNGFKYNEHPFVQGYEQFGLVLYHGGDGYRINCGQNVALQLDSVHQLQNALRLCGIEKEITI